LTKQFLSEYTAWFTSNVAGFNYNRPIILSKKGVELPVYEATLCPGIKFKEGHGWAHDWDEKWNTTSDSLYWEIDCKAPGTYQVEIEYLCKKADTGSRVSCSIGNESREVIINQEFYATQIPSPDRVPRKEAYEMSRWKILKVGIFFISDGKQQVKLKAVKIRNKNVAELNLIRLVTVQ
jgi:arylsulfatase A